MTLCHYNWTHAAPGFDGLFSSSYSFFPPFFSSFPSFISFSYFYLVYPISNSVFSFSSLLVPFYSLFSAFHLKSHFGFCLRFLLRRIKEKKMFIAMHNEHGFCWKINKSGNSSFVCAYYYMFILYLSILNVFVHQKTRYNRFFLFEFWTSEIMLVTLGYRWNDEHIWYHWKDHTIWIGYWVTFDIIANSQATSDTKVKYLLMWQNHL